MTAVVDSLLVMRRWAAIVGAVSNPLAAVLQSFDGEWRLVAFHVGCTAICALYFLDWRADADLTG